MTAEPGHHPNRVYTDHSGGFHLNGASFFNDGEEDCGPALEGLGGLTEAQVDLLGVTPGTAAASGVLALDANAELNDVGVMKVADVLISSAQLLALNATPQTLVAAPGAGVYLELVRAYLLLDYGTTAYDGIAAGEDLQIKYTDGSGPAASAAIETTGFLSATADALAIALPADSPVAVANAALVLHLLSAEIATGDSPLKVRTIYREVRADALTAIS